MEPISFAASVLGVIDQAKTITQSVADFRLLHGTVPREYVELSSRIGMSVKIMQPLLMERIGDEIMSPFQHRLKEWTERLSQAESFFQEQRGFPQEAARVPSHEDLLDLLRGLADETEASIPILFNLKQSDTLRRIEYQLRDMKHSTPGRLGDTSIDHSDRSRTTNITIAVRSIKDHILQGADPAEEILKAQESISRENPEMHPEEQQETLDNIRELLKETLVDLDLARDPMTLPFVIPVPQGDNIQTRVKLDTGSRLNWIHSTILEKAGLTYEPADDAGQFIGAGHDARPFAPLGRASVTWFSENRAITRKNQFLVHDGSLPYDVMLGANWVYENMMNETWAEPVLPIRQIISTAELKTIHQNAVEDGACNEDIKKFQKRQNQAKRAEQRQSKANSRVISAAVSTAATPRYQPSPLQSRASPVLSRRMSAEPFSEVPFSPQQTSSPLRTPFYGTSQPGTSGLGTSQSEVGESSAGSSRTSAVGVEWGSVDGAGEGGSRTQQ